MKLLIAYDASKCSQAIAKDLRRAGLLGGHTALVLSVTDVQLPTLYELPDSELPRYILPGVHQTRAQVAKAVAGALKTAKAGAAAIRSDYPGWKVHAQSCSGSPAESILEKAAEWRPDLIVMGSRGRSTFSHLSIGSVAQRVLQQVPCGVRISRVNLKIPASRSQRVIVGLDGSAHSKKALQSALLRYRESAVELRLVTAIEHSYEDDKQQGIAKRHLEEATRRLREHGFLVSPVAKKGHPADILMNEAMRWKADCIFLGTRGLSRTQRFFLGSISAVVAAHAPCSVEIVK